MSTVDKKTLAGLLLGIGAFALAAKKGSKGSRSFFPEPTGKAPKGADGAFTEEQDEVFFAFKQNAPKRPTTESRYFEAQMTQKDAITRLQSQKSAKQQSLRQLQRSLAQDTFGDATAIAQMQNQMNTIQAQIDNANNIISKATGEIALMDSGYGDYDEDRENELKSNISSAQSELQAAQQLLSSITRVLPQAQKTRMQAQVVSVSSQIAELQTQITEANDKLTELQAQTATAAQRFGKDYTLEEYFNLHSERGYTDKAKARYGAGSPGEAAWENWEKQMDLYRGFGGVTQKFTGEQTDTSSIMGQGFKTGVTPLTPQGAFDGEVDNSDPFAPKEFSLPKFK